MRLTFLIRSYQGFTRAVLKCLWGTLNKTQHYANSECLLLLVTASGIVCPLCFGIHGFAPDCGHVLFSAKDEGNFPLLAEESCMAQSYHNSKAEGLSGRGKCTCLP